MTELRLRLCLSASRRASSPAASFTPSVLHTARPFTPPVLHTVRPFTPSVPEAAHAPPRPSHPPILHTSLAGDELPSAEGAPITDADTKGLPISPLAPLEPAPRQPAAMHMHPTNRPRCTCGTPPALLRLPLCRALHEPRATRIRPRRLWGPSRLTSAHLSPPRLTSANRSRAGYPAFFAIYGVHRPEEADKVRIFRLLKSGGCACPLYLVPPPRPSHLPQPTGPQTPARGPRRQGGAPDTGAGRQVPGPVRTVRPAAAPLCCCTREEATAPRRLSRARADGGRTPPSPPMPSQVSVGPQGGCGGAGVGSERDT